MAIFFHITFILQIISSKKGKWFPCRSLITESFEHDNAIILYEFDLPINQAEKMIQPHQEPVDVINLGTEKDWKEVKVGASLEQSVKKELVKLLKEYVDVFGWSYQYMSGLNSCAQATIKARMPAHQVEVEKNLTRLGCQDHRGGQKAVKCRFHGYCNIPSMDS